MKKGTRIEIPVHYDAWMRGAKYGTLTQKRTGKEGTSDYWLVNMDHPQIKRRLKLWALDWKYARLLNEGREA